MKPILGYVCKVCGCDDPRINDNKYGYYVCPCCHCVGFSDGYIFNKYVSGRGDNKKSPYFRKWEINDN